MYEDAVQLRMPAFVFHSARYMLFSLDVSLDISSSETNELNCYVYSVKTRNLQMTEQVLRVCILSELVTISYALQAITHLAAEIRHHFGHNGR